MSPRIRHPKPTYSTFTGVYCSGFFVRDPALLTALCLLFERVYIPDHIYYVPLAAELQTYGFEFDEWVNHSWTSFLVMPGDNITDDRGVPLGVGSSLPQDEQSKLMSYLQQAAKFYIQYAPLFGSVLESNVFAESIVWGDNGDPAKLPPEERRHAYYQPRLRIRNQGEDIQLARALQQGAAPIIEQGNLAPEIQSSSLASAYASSLLALNAAKLAIPLTKRATAEDILEARAKLGDYLPAFWAEMLRLSEEITAWLAQDASATDVEQAARDFVNKNIRPRIIDVTEKLMKEQRSWASKIIVPIMDAVTLGLSLERLSWPQLLLLGLQAASKAVKNVHQQTAQGADASLAFLIKLNYEMNNVG